MLRNIAIIITALATFACQEDFDRLCWEGTPGCAPMTPTEQGGGEDTGLGTDLEELTELEAFQMEEDPCETEAVQAIAVETWEEGRSIFAHVWGIPDFLIPSIPSRMGFHFGDDEGNWGVGSLSWKEEEALWRSRRHMGEVTTPHSFMITLNLQVEEVTVCLRWGEDSGDYLSSWCDITCDI